MNLLVIGSGGREHAICKKLLSSPKVENVYCAMGNPGMRRDGIQLVNIKEDDHPALMTFVKNQKIDWTFVGPEVPLLNGIVDDFVENGLKIFGPNQAAAMIEGSKEFAKKLMIDCHIPTGSYEVFEDYDEALAFVKDKGVPIVIKADGLAAGKGVVVAETYQQAEDALEEMLIKQRFGKSGTRVVIEEFLEGQEFSLLAFVDGENVYPMIVAQDHKAAYDGDKGPNTGGMGAYSPVPQISQEMVDEAVANILIPAAKGMIKNGTPFAGILYAGLIATNEGPKTIEFNARFGDPETQIILPRLKSDLAEIISDLLNHEEPEIEWYQEQACVGVVVAAEGYPSSNYVTGVALPDFDPTVDVYYAGVTEDEEQKLVSNGGRVYLVSAMGDTLEEAQAKVYQVLNAYEQEGMYYRIDIGDKGIKG